MEVGTNEEACGESEHELEEQASPAPGEHSQLSINGRAGGWGAQTEKSSESQGPWGSARGCVGWGEKSPAGNIT